MASTLLLAALVALPSFQIRSQKDLRLYLATAAQYGSGNRPAALREIRQWGRRQIAWATAALRQNEKHLRSEVKDPDDIDFHTVEAAVLMHAQAGILFLQEQKLRPARIHIDASSELLQWSRRAAAERRNWTTMRAYAFKDRPVDMSLELKESIDARDFYVAVASAALVLGYAEAAGPFAEQARLEAPHDPEVQLVRGCVASGLATEKALNHRDAEAVRARKDAEMAFRDAVTLEPLTHEARLRLGKLLLDTNREAEAEPLLAEVDARATTERQRYLARLFRGRAAERGGRSEEAILSYRRALEARPDSQAARIALAQALEKSSGPGAASEVVGALLDGTRSAGQSDPWFLFHIGPPGLAQAAFDRVWNPPRGR